jgi:hypothetical protein
MAIDKSDSMKKQSANNLQPQRAEKIRRRMTLKTKAISDSEEINRLFLIKAEFEC